MCRGRHAVSTWQLLEPLAGGTASLLQWRLHQIRVHMKHTGHPLLSNEAYSCAADTAVNAISQDKSRGHVLHLCLLTLCDCPIQLIAILQYTGGIQNTVEM